MPCATPSIPGRPGTNRAQAWPAGPVPFPKIALTILMRRTTGFLCTALGAPLYSSERGRHLPSPAERASACRLLRGGSCALNSRAPLSLCELCPQKKEPDRSGSSLLFCDGTGLSLPQFVLNPGQCPFHTGTESGEFAVQIAGRERLVCRCFFFSRRSGRGQQALYPLGEGGDRFQGHVLPGFGQRPVESPLGSI